MENEIEKVNIFIVEDEIILAEDIKYRLSNMGYTVTGMASNAIDALKKIANNTNINIILLDITIKGDLDGIELATLIKAKYDIPFIFLTSNANKDVVERANKTNPHAYILKPFNDRQIDIAINLALINFQSKTQEKSFSLNTNLLPNSQSALKIKDSLFLKKGQHFERVALHDILFLQADSNYCNIFSRAKKFTYATVLKKIEAQLSSLQFLRVHRSYIVNIDKVTGFEGNQLFIDDKKIPISKNYRNTVFKLFNTL